VSGEIQALAVASKGVHSKSVGESQAGCIDMCAQLHGACTQEEAEKDNCPFIACLGKCPCLGKC